MRILSTVNSVFTSVTYQSGETVVDPGDISGVDGIKNVLLTHCHFDHIYGLNDLVENNPDAKVYTNAHGAKMLLDAKLNMSKYSEDPFVFNFPKNIMVVEDGEEVEIGGDIKAKAVFTPGHNPSCITWIFKDAIFTGDAYIPGVKTVTNLPGSNKEQAKKSENLIMELAKGRKVFPGHSISNQLD